VPRQYIERSIADCGDPDNAQATEILTLVGESRQFCTNDGAGNGSGFWGKRTCRYC